ncbi:hypothetical protein ACLOJK_028404 [Asimina triloba]
MSTPYYGTPLEHLLWCSIIFPNPAGFPPSTHSSHRPSIQIRRSGRRLPQQTTSRPELAGDSSRPPPVCSQQPTSIRSDASTATSIRISDDRRPAASSPPEPAAPRTHKTDEHLANGLKPISSSTSTASNTRPAPPPKSGQQLHMIGPPPSSPTSSSIQPPFARFCRLNPAKPHASRPIQQHVPPSSSSVAPPSRPITRDRRQRPHS